MKKKFQLKIACRQSILLFSMILSLIIFGCKKPKSEPHDIGIKNPEFSDVLMDTNLVRIDSFVKSKDIIIYKLIYSDKNIDKKIYEIENQDHSIEFQKKYTYKPLSYVCYEINDLPTGLTWDVFYNMESKSFYETEKYDVHAVGDTLDRNSVDFQERKAIVISASDKSKKYTIKLNKIWN
jgi:hypothetical protein